MAFDQARKEKEKARQMMYDKNGNVVARGWLRVQWNSFKDILIPAGVFLALFVVLSRFSNWVGKRQTELHEDFERKSEENARSVGKLKGERYLLKPTRVIDDPDFLHPPARSGLQARPSKLFDNDDFTTQYAERSRAR